MRIIINLDACYLAYITLDTQKHTSLPTNSVQSSRPGEITQIKPKLNKYYHRLVDIPIAELSKDRKEYKWEIEPLHGARRRKRVRKLKSSSRPMSSYASTCKMNSSEGKLCPIEWNSHISSKTNTLLNGAMNTLAKIKLNSESSSGFSLTTNTTQLYQPRHGKTLRVDSQPKFSEPQSSDDDTIATLQMPTSRLPDTQSTFKRAMVSLARTTSDRQNLI